MELLEYIKSTPLLRPTAFPCSHNLVIVCRCSALMYIPDHLLINLRAVYIVDPQNKVDNEGIEKFKKKHEKINIFDLPVLKNEASFDVVHYHHKYEYGPLAACAGILRSVGFESFFNFMPLPYNTGISTTHMPGYFRSNQNDLKFVFDLLEDEESKKVFASRVRAIETGNVGYVRVSKYPEYFHPMVQPENGDVVIDGGVSESIGPQVQFSRAVGESGQVYGFEPDPIGFCKAYESLQEKCHFKNYRIVPLGLWKRKDTLHFYLAGQGTHVSTGGRKNSVKCKVVSIDEFVASNSIKGVHFIKLDVEGAEADAIKGAIKTIKNNKPKLAISLYHKSEDLYFLPRLIYEIIQDYKFYIGHHHASLHETILYASPNLNCTE